MHHHDYELIMALAEGALDPAAAASARAEVESCAHCSQDLELQLEGLGALQGLPRAGLTELESARLLRDLRRELGIAPQQARQPTARRRLPLAALGTAAAVLMAVVLVGPGLNLIGGGDSADSPEIAAATTSAAATTAAPTAGADMRAPQEGNSLADELAEAAPVTTSAPTAAAPSTTAIAQAVVESDLFAYFGEENPNLEEIRDDLVLNSFDVPALRSQLLRQSDDSIPEEDFGAATACIQLTLTSEDNLTEGFQVARGRIDGREVILIVYLAEVIEESALIAHAADTCEVLERAGP